MLSDIYTEGIRYDFTIFAKGTKDSFVFRVNKEGFIINTSAYGYMGPGRMAGIQERLRRP